MSSWWEHFPRCCLHHERMWRYLMKTQKLCGSLRGGSSRGLKNRIEKVLPRWLCIWEILSLKEYLAIRTLGVIIEGGRRKGERYKSMSAVWRRGRHRAVLTWQLLTQAQALPGHLSYSRCRAWCYKAFRENEDNLLQMINERCSFCITSTSALFPHWPGMSRGEEGGRWCGKTIKEIARERIQRERR